MSFDKKSESSDIILIDNLPVTIDKPGLYHLNNSTNLNETAITIRSSHVMIDGMGYTIQGNLSTGAKGIDIDGTDTGFHHVTITNTTFQEFDIGIAVNGVSDCSFHNLVLNGNVRAGFEIINSSYLSFSDNEVKNNHNDISGGYGFTIATSHHMNITGNSVSGNGKSGKSYSGGMFITQSTDCLVSQSIISSNPGTGIRISSDSRDIYLTGSEVSMNLGCGAILENCFRPVITGCTIESNKGAGIDMSLVSEPSVQRNTLNMNSMGMSMTDTSHLVLSGNSMNNNRIGFDISASDINYLIHTIDRTNLINSRLFLYLYNERQMNIGQKENPGLVIAVNCSDIIISDIILSKNGAGILVAGSENISVQDVTFIDNGIGFKADFRCSHINLERLHAERNLVCGYSISDTNLVTLNSLYGQDSPLGIYLKNIREARLEKISMNKMTGPKTRKPSGLVISNSTNISISRSEFTECSYAGLISDSKNLNISDTTFSQNEFTGSLILSGPVSIQQNSFLLSKGSGIIFMANDSLVSDNSIKQNEKQGMLMMQSERNIFTRNIFNNTNNILLKGLNPGNNWNGTPFSSYSRTSPTGNYWGQPDLMGYSDVCDPDNAGFCSEPFIIDTDNTDFHPLSGVFSGYSIHQLSDMNNNGREDLQDVVVLMKKVRSGANDTSYDFSGDGRINLQDVVTLFQRIRTQ